MTIFVDWAFPASGSGNASRTLPDRLAEIKNVKDWGATGLGLTSDTTAIQAAIDAGSGGVHGTIYFPPGSYLIGTPGLKFNYAGDTSIRFVGCGAASVLSGNFAGFILERDFSPSPTDPYLGPVVVEDLVFNNSNINGGCLRIGSTRGVTVRNCSCSGAQGVWFCSSDYGPSEACIMETSNVTGGTLRNVNGNGVVIAGSALMSSCDMQGCVTGVRVFGYGAGIMNCRFEVNGQLISVGKDPSGTLTPTGNFYWLAGGTESNLAGLDMYQCENFAVIGAASSQGDCYWYANIKTAEAGSVTMTGLTSGTIGVASGGFNGWGDITITSISSGSGFVAGERVTLVPGPTGAKILSVPGGGHTGAYVLKSDAVRYLKIFDADLVQNGVFAGFAAGSNATDEAIYIDDSTTRAGLVFIGCRANHDGTITNNAGTCWRLPTTAHTADFIACTEISGNPSVPQASPVIVYTYANLPSSPREGDEYDISNSNTNTWGATAAAGGSNHVRVRYNSATAVWTVMGK